MTNCNYCGKGRKVDHKSRHGLAICSKCKKNDDKELVKDETLLTKLRAFLNYLYQSESINAFEYNDLLHYESMYGTDGCDVSYILQHCAENSPRHLSEYFWKFEELV